MAVCAAKQIRSPHGAHSRNTHVDTGAVDWRGNEGRLCAVCEARLRASQSRFVMSNGQHLFHRKRYSLVYLFLFDPPSAIELRKTSSVTFAEPRKEDGTAHRMRPGRVGRHLQPSKTAHDVIRLTSSVVHGTPRAVTQEMVPLQRGPRSSAIPRGKPQRSHP